MGKRLDLSCDTSDSDDESDEDEIGEMIEGVFGSLNTTSWLAGESNDYDPEEPNEEAAKFFRLLKDSEQNRAKNHIIHTTGSKSFQQWKEEEEEKTGQEIGRVQMFELTHVQSNGQAVNEDTQQALNKFKDLTSQVVEGSLQMSEDEMFVQVFGPERRGRVRGYGAGVTPNELWGSSSIVISNLEKRLQESEKRLQESEKKREEADLKVNTLQAKVNHIEDLLQHVLSRMPPPTTQSETYTHD